jgi:hypothetical protein
MLSDARATPPLTTPVLRLPPLAARATSNARVPHRLAPGGETVTSETAIIVVGMLAIVLFAALIPIAVVCAMLIDAMSRPPGGGPKNTSA